ncbi:hypothetical protein FB451DRAFT_1176704 [Mycena latifolia]|nr:hypothetical protein FB451DRAFT_1176704 [Mycena latifolia]
MAEERKYHEANSPACSGLDQRARTVRTSEERTKCMAGPERILGVQEMRGVGEPQDLDWRGFGEYSRVGRAWCRRAGNPTRVSSSFFEGGGIRPFASLWDAPPLLSIPAPYFSIFSRVVPVQIGTFGRVWTVTLAAHGSEVLDAKLHLKTTIETYCSSPASIRPCFRRRWGHSPFDREKAPHI